MLCKVLNINEIRWFFVPFISVLLLSCQQKPANVFPVADWETKEPIEVGIDAAKMQEALDYLAENSGPNKNRELLIIRNGYAIFSGENVDSTHNIYSCSKVFTSTVLGVMTQKGKISPDSIASAYEPLLKEYYPEVTFRHFTTMTSGYSAEGDTRWKSANSSDWSWTPYSPDKPLFAPGSAYAYWDEAQMMFGRCLTKVLKEPMHDYLKREVTDKIGMGEWSWLTEGDADGVEINNGCNYVHLNAKQFARFGWLFLNKGNWNGEQVISPAWIEEATRVQVPENIPVANTDRSSMIGPGCYGYNWWINGKLANGELKLPGAPGDCYFATGLKNNKCIVIPGWNMVVVRLGLDGNPDDEDKVYGHFL